MEDLRPNAFAGGHGRSAVLVFSLGMLQTFDEEELAVAIDHELMHLKNRDPFFRSTMIGLIALSFFNPVPTSRILRRFGRGNIWPTTGQPARSGPKRPLRAPLGRQPRYPVM